MNQMEEIQKLYAKKKEYKIPKESRKGQIQVKIEVKPLELDEMSSLKTLEENAPLKDVVGNAKKMFAMSLGIKEEDAGKLSFEYMEDILAAIMDVNNFNEEDLKKTGIKDFIADKKKRIQKQKENEDGQSDTAAPGKSPE